MMRRRSIFVLVTILAAVALYFLTQGGGDESDLDMEAMVRRQTLREMNAETQAHQQATDLGILAELGRGQAVPAHLRSSMALTGDFWFVGRPDSEFRAQVPFEPGRLRRPPSTAAPLAPNPGFVGADSCQSCHEDKYKSYVKTAHYRTSRLATRANISGSFEPDENQMRTRIPDVFFRMVVRDEDCFQRVSFFDWQFEVPFDLIIGSSKMGESYVFWHGDKLFQMNCTYLSEADAWINSPGYVDGDASYARPILPGCVDCHTTFIDLRKMPNRYTPKSLILGISCERCHGPGKQHVDFHRANPSDKNSRHMSVPSKLPRQAQMDVCGQCHTSNKKLNDRPPFQFRPGDRIADHYDLLEDHDASSNRVHTSNQVARLALSECFKQSEMACVDCHDPHQNERGQAALFSRRCMKCHEQEHCGMRRDVAYQLSDNCIDCHMPRRSGSLRVDTAEGRIFPPLRDHYIRVDEQATKEFVAAQGSKNDRPVTTSD